NSFFEMARKALDEPGARVVTKKGDAEAVIKSSAKVVEAVYELPYLDHAMMEPMNCTAHVTPDRAEVWVGTQNSEEAVSQISGLNRFIQVMSRLSEAYISFPTV